MNYVYSAAGALIVMFVFLILKKARKNRADYLLIAINVIVGLFLLSDVLVRWRLTSAAVILQNGLPLLLFPLFAFYVLQFTQAKHSISRAWLLLLVPLVAFLVLSLVEHYVLNHYPTTEAVLHHFTRPRLSYHIIFKGSQLLFIGVLAVLLRQLAEFKKALKEGYSTIETIDVQWLQHFTWIYLGSIAFTFVLFLAQNVGLLPMNVYEVFGIIYGVLVLSVLYLNYHGIQHYTLSQEDPELV